MLDTKAVVRVHELLKTDKYIEKLNLQKDSELPLPPFENYR